jgi:hypothetical protein
MSKEELKHKMLDEYLSNKIENGDIDPVLRTFFKNLREMSVFCQEVSGVQPMDSPTGTVFYRNHTISKSHE